MITNDFYTWNFEKNMENKEYGIICLLCKLIEDDSPSIIKEDKQ